MNSIQKEREAFEKAFAQTEFYRNKADLYSLLADIDDEPFDFFRKNGFGDYSIGEAQAAWSAWQAAKAQAVPEGFVLMPMVPSERMIHAVRQCYEGEAYLPYSLYSEFVNQAIIERMEAQEPAND